MINRRINTLIRLLLAAGTVAAFSPGDSVILAAGFRIEGRNTVVDQGGRSLTVQEPFKRMISLYGGHTENLFSLGLDREVIGVSRHETYPPRALVKQVFSYREDPERFLAVRPDLVLIRPMIDRGYPQFVSMLEQNGIAVISLQPGNVEEIYTYWRILGLLTGRPQQASDMIARFKAATADFRSLTIGKVDRKRVYFEAIHGKMKTFTPDSMAVFALETAGGINIAADAEAIRNTNIAYYGKERLLSRGREIDVYLAQTGAMNKPTRELIMNEPGFKAIRAVAAGEIHFIDEQIVSRPTMRLLDGIYRIGNILYPADFDGTSLEILNRAQKGGRH